jgi:hypothetical protein
VSKNDDIKATNNTTLSKIMAAAVGTKANFCLTRNGLQWGRFSLWKCVRDFMA